jgi:NAD(P)-dependent dehydrogenase (short-subunit alcohol dehydrogenase family)
MQINKYERGLKDKVALVTGAATRNGQAICERLAEEGAVVIIADIVTSSYELDLMKESNIISRHFIVDVTDIPSVDSMVNEIISVFGRIDILVHNIGIYEEEPFELLTFQQWNQMLQITLNSLFICTQAVLPIMKKNSFGRIITMSSDTVWLGTPYLTHYVTAKMGVIGFTRSLAGEVGRYGVTINTITMGLTATQRQEKQSPLSSSLLEHIIPNQAVIRSDEPEDIANVVAFLALPASGIISGQTINVDGGVARH